MSRARRFFKRLGRNLEKTTKTTVEEVYGVDIKEQKEQAETLLALLKEDTDLKDEAIYSLLDITVDKVMERDTIDPALAILLTSVQLTLDQIRGIEVE